MAKHSLTIAAIAALIISTLLTVLVRADDKADSKVIARWIAQLGSKNFKDREEATAALVRIGPAARSLLETACAGKDAEVRRRAEIVLEKIEKDADRATLLAPKQIRLSFQDTPVLDAVAEVAKISGFAIQFEGDRTKLANRKITLDTGEVPAWEALEQFCRKAGLTERGPVPPKSQEASANNADPRVQKEIILRNQMIRKQRIVAVGDRVVPVPNNSDAGRIVLVEGKPDNLPHWHAGAVRIRALPATTHGIDPIKTQGETYLTLEIRPEPTLAWQGILDVRIDKAIDQSGQVLSQALPPSGPGNQVAQQMTALAMNGLVVNGAVFVDANDGQPFDLIGNQRQFPVRLKLAGKPSQVLKEIQGTVAVQVMTPHQPLITVEDVLKAQGRTVKGPEKSFLRVLEISRSDDGQIKLRIEVRPPTMPINDLAAVGRGRVVRVWAVNGRMGKVVMQDTDNMNGQNFALQDAKGQNFQPVEIREILPTGTNTHWEYQLGFQSRPGLREASKLVFSGRRLVTIEIPFTLKNVPLP